MPDDTSVDSSELDSSGGTSTAADAGNETDTITTLKLDRDKAARKRDEFRKAKEKAEARASELEGQLGSLNERLSAFEEAQRAAEEQAAAKSGDAEKLSKQLADVREAHKKALDDLKGTLSKTLDEERAAKTALEAKLNKSFVEKGLLEALTAHSANPAAMKVQLQALYQFEPVEDDDGNFVGVKAMDSYKSIQELHDEVCDRFSLPFKKSPRQGGTGTPPAKPASGAQTGGIPANFDLMSKDDKRKWMSENRELAAEVMNKVGNFGR